MVYLFVNEPLLRQQRPHLTPPLLRRLLLLLVQLTVDFLPLVVSYMSFHCALVRREAQKIPLVAG